MGRLQTLSIDGFLNELASADRSQGRLGVAALTAACCAAQLEAQCREVLTYRDQAPGPYDALTLIERLGRVRARLLDLLDRTVEVERAATAARALPDASLDDRVAKQVAREETATGLLLCSLEAASLIWVVGALGRRVHILRREIRGSVVTAETTSALLGAASSGVMYVLERSLRSSRSRDRRLHVRGVRAMARLAQLCLLEPPANELRRATPERTDASRLN